MPARNLLSRFSFLLLAMAMLCAPIHAQSETYKMLAWNYVDQARKGDHICYISNLKKFQTHCPNWRITVGLDEILKQIIESQEQQLRAAPSAR